MFYYSIVWMKKLKFGAINLLSTQVVYARINNQIHLKQVGNFCSKQCIRLNTPPLIYCKGIILLI